MSPLVVDGSLSLLLSVVEGAVAGIVGSDTLVTAAVGGTGEGSAGSDTVGDGATGELVDSSETGDGAELGITEAVLDLSTSVLDASLGGVVELVEVTVATGDSAGHLNVSGVVSIVGDITLVIDELSAVVVVVGTVVPGSEVVGPAAISEIGTVGIAVRVGSWGIAEGVSAEADGVADVARGVLVTLVAEASLLLAEVVVVVTGDGVEGDVDLARVVAPLVIDGFLGIPMVVGSPLVPCVVNPLVVALALVADLSVGVVLVGNVKSLLTKTATESSTFNSAESGSVSSSVTSKSDSAATVAGSTAMTVESTKATEALETTNRADAMTATSIRSVSFVSTIRGAAVASIASLSGNGTFGTVSVVGSLMTVVLVVSTISLRLDSVVVGSLPGLGGNDCSSEKNSLEHCKVKFSRLYFSVKMGPFKWFCLTVNL